VTDIGMKSRVKVLLGGPGEAGERVDVPSDTTTAQHRALQVLALAERTAEEHVAGARREADTICSDARATAEQIVRDAQAHAHGLKREAEKELAGARATAKQIDREAQAHAERTRHDAEKIMSDARIRADETAENAQANADELMSQAQMRYDDVVGGLAAKREALQRQIEALEKFDSEYRARLTTFMQNQLRTLWVDEPQLNTGELDKPVPPAPPKALPAKAKDSSRS
jgi:vacuolar-type H+-ATPase subunit H